MHRTPADKSTAPKSTSVFSPRHNWNHLTTRPAQQEPVIDGVRALAISWVVVLHLVFYEFPYFPAEVTAILSGRATSWVMNGTLASTCSLSSAVF